MSGLEAAPAAARAADGRQATSKVAGLTLALIAGFVVVGAAMVWAVQVPPLLDYPNHLARIWLLAGGIRDPFLSTVYAVDWSRAGTNIGIDLLAAGLGPLVGPETLARSLLFIAIILPPLGAAALHGKVFGSVHPWQIAPLFLAWCATLTGGFLNFQIGLGLALLASVGDIELRDRWLPLFLWRIVVSSVLMIDHVFAAGFYMVLMGGLTLPERLADLRDRQQLLRAVRRIAVGVVACLVPAAVILLRASYLPGTEARGLDIIWNTPLLSLLNFWSAITSYDLRFDMAFFFPVAAVAAAAVLGRRYKLHGGLMVAAGFLLVLSLVSPRHALATGWISWRFPIMTLLVVAAAMRPFDGVSPRRLVAIAGVLALATFGRTALVASFWAQGDRDARSVETVLAHLPRGSIVLPMLRLPDPNAHSEPFSRRFVWNQDTFRHLATLATSRRGSFVPTIFTARGKQPLAVQPAFMDLAVPEGDVHTISTLICPDMYSLYSRVSRYLKDWRNRFTYVLLLNADQSDAFVGSMLPEGLTPVASDGFAALYAIQPGPPAPAGKGPAACPVLDWSSFKKN